VSNISISDHVALQRCDRFVARTMNWLYDHLRFIPRYSPFVLCDALQNRDEFPDLTAWCANSGSVARRIWRRFAGDHLYPGDWRRLKRLSPHVLHSHFGYVAVQDYILQKKLAVPWFVSFYGADVYATGRQLEWRETYARVFDQASRVLALGPVMKNYLERLGCPSEKVIIHPLGVDVDNLPKKPRILKPDSPLKILFAGTLREKKGIQYILEAAALAKRASMRFELQIVGDVMGKPGDAETKESVLRYIPRLGLENVVTYRSFLSFCELIELALHSHVFVAPSVTAADGDAEGTPFVLQQMMATGMPAIATVHSDIPYIFGDHAHLLVSERDAMAIADRLQYYVDQPDALLADGEALCEQIRRFFDVRTCATRLSNLYDAVR
jgi:colanic acid/amylovoran biosynthesis glycosyltransferase